MKYADPNPVKSSYRNVAEQRKASYRESPFSVIAIHRTAKSSKPSPLTSANLKRQSYWESSSVPTEKALPIRISLIFSLHVLSFHLVSAESKRNDPRRCSSSH